ncbi:MAG: HNH endonuclease family protein, partial [Ruminococcus sp.]|nr:HNH endonuclease family protein [Ruminococcus sp.]
ADEAYEQWKQILNNIAPDDYSVQERFFRQYYNAFREELNKPYTDPDKKYHLGYLATRTTLLDIYEQMIKHNYTKLLDDLLVKSQKYALIINNSDEEHVYTSALLDLARISGAPSYLLLLYILSKQEELKLTDAHIQQIVKLLITFFVRRNVTDVPNTRKLTQLFIDLISDIKNLQGDAIIHCIRHKFKSVAATDEEFKAKLRGSLYDENPEAVRFILCSIESEHQTKEIYSDLWSRDSSNKYIWTIEHIFPEGQNIPDPWVKMIANGDKELAKQYLSEYVHTLGNLTITGYNQNLSNMSFDKKKDRKSKDKSKDIGYRNGLFLNQDVVTEDIWTIDKIKNRTNKIVNILLNMYQW